MIALLNLLVAFTLSAGATWRLIDWLTARQFVAVENDRTMHAGRVPQGGGMAVVAVAALVAVVFAGPATIPAYLALLLCLAIALAVMSAVNDHRELSPRLRLAAHLGAAALVLATLPASTLLFGGWLPWSLDRLVALLAYAWFINLTNFMDGIDGISGVELITVALGTVLVHAAAGSSAPMTSLALSIAGAAAGFLVWNWHKARIFLGDVGSIPLGFLTGALLIDVAATVGLAPAVILPLYYLTDATATLARRFLRGEKLSQPHREHAYQRAARAVGSHSAVVERIAACNAVLVCAALLATEAPWLGLAAAVAAVAVLMRALERLAAR